MTSVVLCVCMYVIGQTRLRSGEEGVFLIVIVTFTRVSVTVIPITATAATTATLTQLFSTVVRISRLALRPPTALA